MKKCPKINRKTAIPMSKSSEYEVMIRFHQIVYSLSKEGYVIQLCVKLTKDNWMAKLIHSNNRNVIMLKTTSKQISLWKNGKLKKTESLA